MPSSTSLFRLVYQSQATPPFTAATLQALLRNARTHNQAHHLTGLLLYVEGQFLQVIEGPEPALSKLYNQIRQDSRHTEVGTISYEPIPARAFPDWRMGYALVSPAELKQATGFLPLAQSPGFAAHPPAELWELLRGFAQGVAVDE
ncbi:BLUF domain-containing protein [Hymenobacter psychrophilus]|uniref:Sensors of blue-light using FAD n=1 Tax=Hymenobacter psychrophilus TaxID=651662 RepID=A0A1H3HLL5_9BACT|nr:BLUF domain-containing protein [Hymenobacter psychrophilus]SDY16403.1 Sensors of blue-light using FAD [Hymenobacter psychrophilus]